MIPFSATSGIIFNFQDDKEILQRHTDPNFVIQKIDDHLFFQKVHNICDSKNMDFTMPMDESCNSKIHKFDSRKSMYHLPISTRKDRFKDRHSYAKMYIYKGLVDKRHYPSIKRILKNIDLWDFNIFALERFTAGFPLTYLSIELFEKHNLIRDYKLDMTSLHKFFMIIEKSYHQANPYHNALHAADVTQAINCIIQDPKIFQHLDSVEVLCSLLSTICHDVDHPGLNNTYMINSNHHLSILYKKESVLENHHWQFSLSVLEEIGLFSHLSQDLWKKIVYKCGSLIRATDISKQNFYISQFTNNLISTGKDSSSAIPPTEDDKLIILQMAIKCADICNPCRRWDICNCWAYLVTEEFFQQGDLEKKGGLPVSPIMDRDKCKLAVIQRDFIRFLVLPLFTVWGKYAQSELSRCFLDTIAHNQSLWQQLADIPVAQSDSVILASIQSVYDRLQLMQVMDYTQGHQLSHLQQLRLQLDLNSICKRNSCSIENTTGNCSDNNNEDDRDTVSGITALQDETVRSISTVNTTVMSTDSDDILPSRDNVSNLYSLDQNSPMFRIQQHSNRRGSLPITLQCSSNRSDNLFSKKVISRHQQQQQQQKLMASAIRRTSLQTGPGYSTMLMSAISSRLFASAVSKGGNDSPPPLSTILLASTQSQAQPPNITTTSTGFPTSYRRGSAPAIRPTSHLFHYQQQQQQQPFSSNQTAGAVSGHHNHRRASLTGGCCGLVYNSGQTGGVSVASSIISAHSLNDIQIPQVG